MSDADWEEAYRAAWHTFYTPEHINTILRRTCAAKNLRPGTTLSTILWFYLMILFEGVHPLEGGALRLKSRRDRRSRPAARKSGCVLFAILGRHRAQSFGKYARVYLRCKAMLKAALKAPDRWTYTDLAIAPPQADEFEALDLYHATTGGEAALKRKYRDDAIREHGHVHDETAPPYADRDINLLQYILRVGAFPQDTRARAELRRGETVDCL